MLENAKIAKSMSVRPLFRDSMPLMLVVGRGVTTLEILNC